MNAGASSQAVSAPIAGVRVVELLSGPMRLTGRLLADFGAEVVHVSRRPNRAADVPPTALPSRADVETLALGLGKSVMLVDPHSPMDRAVLRSEIARADILIEDELTDFGDDLSVAALRKTYPDLIIVSVSPFGREGPMSAWRATDPVLHALSGGLSRSGIPGRAPLLPPAAIATRSAAMQAAFVALLAFAERLQSGQGDWLDFSILDGVVQTVDPGFGVAGSAAAGVRASELPRGRPDAHMRYPIIKCADGFVRLVVLSPRQWRGLFQWIGSPVEFADPSFEKVMVRFGSPTLIPAIARFFANKTCSELEEEAHQFGVPAAVLLTFDEAVETDQNQARRFFTSVSLAGQTVRLPKCPVEIDGLRLGERAPEPAPTLVRDSLFALPPAQVEYPVRPLAGLRVLDLGVIVVGAETGRLLADAGAEVIKVESAAFPDGSRQSITGIPMSPSFAAGHRNKRSLMLDLRDKRGKSVFNDLLSKADVLLSNFKPGTLESLGYDAAALQAVNPRLISIESSAFGPTGPTSRRMGYGPLVRAATGLSAAWTYPGEAESFSDAMTVFPDHVAARLGALAALALLIRRRRTHQGGVASIAQAEVILDQAGVDLAVAALERDGGRIDHPPEDKPWDVFGCAGDDEWCVVTVETAEQISALESLMGLTPADESWDGPALAAHRESLIAALTEWMIKNSAHDAMHTLQELGVPAGAMLRVADMPQFPHFSERGFFRLVSHPYLTSPFLVETRPVCAERLLDPDHAPAPVMGQDSKATLRDWLGLSEDKIDTLINSSVVSLNAS